MGRHTTFNCANVACRFFLREARDDVFSELNFLEMRANMGTPEELAVQPVFNLRAGGTSHTILRESNVQRCVEKKGTQFPFRRLIEWGPPGGGTCGDAEATARRRR